MSSGFSLKVVLLPFWKLLRFSFCLCLVVLPWCAQVWFSLCLFFWDLWCFVSVRPNVFYPFGDLLAIVSSNAASAPFLLVPWTLAAHVPDFSLLYCFLSFPSFITFFDLWYFLLMCLPFQCLFSCVITIAKLSLEVLILVTVFFSSRIFIQIQIMTFAILSLTLLNILISYFKTSFW